MHKHEIRQARQSRSSITAGRVDCVQKRPAEASLGSQSEPGAPLAERPRALDATTPRILVRIMGPFTPPARRACARSIPDSALPPQRWVATPAEPRNAWKWPPRIERPPAVRAWHSVPTVPRGAPRLQGPRLNTLAGGGPPQSCLHARDRLPTAGVGPDGLGYQHGDQRRTEPLPRAEVAAGPAIALSAAENRAGVISPTRFS